MHESGGDVVTGGVAGLGACKTAFNRVGQLQSVFFLRGVGKGLIPLEEDVIHGLVAGRFLRDSGLRTLRRLASSDWRGGLQGGTVGSAEPGRVRGRGAAEESAAQGGGCFKASVQAGGAFPAVVILIALGGVVGRVEQPGDGIVDPLKIAFRLLHGFHQREV